MKKNIINFGKDSIIYGFGSALSRSLSILTLPLFTSYLSREEYGIIAMLAILGMVLEPVFGLGVSAAMGLSYFKDDHLVKKSQTVWGVFAIHLISISALLSVVFLFPEFLGSLVRLPPECSYLVQIYLLSTAFVILNISFSTRIQFEKKSIQYVSLTATSAIISAVISVFTVVYMKLGITGIIYGQIAGNMFSFFSFFTLGVNQTTFAFEKRIVREILSNGIPLIPSFAFSFLLMHGNKYLLEYYHGLESLGIYAIGFSLGVTISIITGGITKAWFPFFMSYLPNPKASKPIFEKILTYYFCLIGLLCAAYFIFAKPMVILLTNEKFHDSYIVIGFVALAHFIQIIFNFFLPNLYFEKKVKYVTIIQAVSVIISIPIFILLIESYSVIGCAISICVSNLLAAVLLYLCNSLFLVKSIKFSYEWIRIAFYTVLFSFSVILYELLPTFPLTLEIFKSLICLISLCSITFVLLPKSEKDAFKTTLFKSYLIILRI